MKITSTEKSVSIETVNGIETFEIGLIAYAVKGEAVSFFTAADKTRIASDRMSNITVNGEQLTADNYHEQLDALFSFGGPTPIPTPDDAYPSVVDHVLEPVWWSYVPDIDAWQQLVGNVEVDEMDVVVVSPKNDSRVAWQNAGMFPAGVMRPGEGFVVFAKNQPTDPISVTYVKSLSHLSASGAVVCNLAPADTLQDVTSRGASTTLAVSVGASVAGTDAVQKQQLEASQALQDADIASLQSDVDVMKGAWNYLTAYNFGTSTPTQQQLTDYANSQGVPPKEGLTVVNSFDDHAWRYDSTNTQTWQDQGYDVIAQATNSTVGIVKGSTDNLKVSVGTDAEMSVNGLASALDSKIEGATLGGAPVTVSLKTIQLPAYPTTLPASDVYPWAKQPTKPAYTAEEVGGQAQPLFVTTLGNGSEITTTQFLERLTDIGAFNTLYWCGIGEWYFNSAATISDTNCGKIGLAGAVIEKFGRSGGNADLMIRITAANYKDPNNSTPRAIFVYRNVGDEVYPATWDRYDPAMKG